MSRVYKSNNRSGHVTPVANIFFWIVVALLMLFLLTNPFGLSLSIFIGIITGGGALLGVLITAFFHERMLYPAQRFASEEESVGPLFEQEASASYDQIMLQITGVDHKFKGEPSLTSGESLNSTPLFQPSSTKEFENMLQKNFYAKAFFKFLDTIPSTINHSVNKDKSLESIKAMKATYMAYTKAKITSKREVLDNREYKEFLKICENFVNFIKGLNQQNAGKLGVIEAELNSKLEHLIDADQPNQPHPSFLSH